MNDGSILNMYKQPDVQFVNPISLSFQNIVGLNIHMDVQRYKLTEQYRVFKKHEQLLEFDLESKIHKVAFEHAIEYANKMHKEIFETHVPDDMFEILKSTKKRIHEKLIKRIPILDTMMLEHFIFSAYRDHGFSYSTFTTENISAGIDPRKMPSAVLYDEKKEILSSGDTALTDGQIKMAIQQRNTIIAKFVDKGEQWHCFFYTMGSITGKEHDGYKHIHYISHSFGVSREEVVLQLKSKRYHLKSAISIPYNRN